MNSNEHTSVESIENETNELSDDIEVVGPGSLLREAREHANLSQQDVANKLNFRLTLVQDIENEIFDNTLPATFNRGYLRNYAKLVQISQSDVLASYELLSDAKRQCAELQSFSKGTEKQAEHNLVMWVTYLILAVLIGATVVWWMQTSSLLSEPTIEAASTNTSQVSTPSATTAPEIESKPVTTAPEVEKETAISETTNNSEQTLSQLSSPIGAQTAAQGESNDTDLDVQTSDVAAVASNLLSTQPRIDDALSTPTNSDDSPTIKAVPPAQVVFTFAGDCWVNIYDATGERVAWGVKKSGYIMRISGQPPFKVTLGKPELVTIDYNDSLVDTSSFLAGNIAKFSLPLEP